MKIARKKGQSTAEYAILIALIVAAAVGMQVYVRRSLSAGVKFAVDKVKKDATNATAQYEPYYLESSYNQTVNEYKDTEETLGEGEVLRTFGADNKEKTTSRTGYQKMKDVSKAD